jgi:hypothetical protein
MIKYFGHIDNKKIMRNVLGFYASLCWQKIPKHFPFVKLDCFVIMPNHIHGIIITKSVPPVWAQNLAPIQEERVAPIREERVAPIREENLAPIR